MFDGEATTELLAQQGLTWSSHTSLDRTGNELPRAMVDAIFELGPVEGANTKVLTVNTNTVGLVKLTAVNEIASDGDSSQSEVQQRLASFSAQQTYTNFVEALRESADVQLVTQ
jgi:peptidyl-prolyl cis-trans isomerase D